MNINYSVIEIYSLKGRMLNQVQAFLEGLDLMIDKGIEYTVCVLDGDKIIATASRRENILLCFGVDEDYQGEGLTGDLLTYLIKNAAKEGYDHLFIYTKPDAAARFLPYFFYPIVATKQVCLLENKKNGITKFIENYGDIACEDSAGIVMNCNPFTKGHLYLAETAAARCSRLFVFVVSEDKSLFSASERFEMVSKGLKHLDNAYVLSTGPYLISSATFPSYFLKERTSADEVYMELDLRIFCEHFAKPLGIKKRFVGSEPFSEITAAYNLQMKKILPQYGMELIQLERVGGSVPISASEVRRLILSGDLTEAEKLVPGTSVPYLRKKVQNV